MKCLKAFSDDLVWAVIIFLHECIVGTPYQHFYHETPRPFRMASANLQLRYLVIFVGTIVVHYVGGQNYRPTFSFTCVKGLRLMTVDVEPG